MVMQLFEPYHHIKLPVKVSWQLHCQAELPQGNDNKNNDNNRDNNSNSINTDNSACSAFKLSSSIEKALPTAGGRDAEPA